MVLSVFQDDDEAYCSWLFRNAEDGWVVNCTPTGKIPWLHRANCPSIDIRANDAGRRWTHSYIKVCADKPRALEEWVAQRSGLVPERCSRC